MKTIVVAVIGLNIMLLAWISHAATASQLPDQAPHLTLAVISICNFFNKEQKDLKKTNADQYLHLSFRIDLPFKNTKACEAIALYDSAGRHQGKDSEI